MENVEVRLYQPRDAVRISEMLQAFTLYRQLGFAVEGGTVFYSLRCGA